MQDVVRAQLRQVDVVTGTALAVGMSRNQHFSLGVRIEMTVGGTNDGQAGNAIAIGRIDHHPAVAKVRKQHGSVEMKMHVLDVEDEALKAPQNKAVQLIGYALKQLLSVPRGDAGTLCLATIRHAACSRSRG